MLSPLLHPKQNNFDSMFGRISSQSAHHISWEVCKQLLEEPSCPSTAGIINDSFLYTSQLASHLSDLPEIQIL